MSKLLKKILTKKALRNATAISAFVVATANAGAPWMQS